MAARTGDPEKDQADNEREDVDTVWMRGEGGSVILMDLPLPHDIAKRVAAGQISRVNEDGSPWEASDKDVDLLAETEVEAAERERLAALEYARLKRENPAADPIELRDQAAETAGDDVPAKAGDDAKPTPKPKLDKPAKPTSDK